MAMTIEVRCAGFCGRRVRGKYVRHLRTFTGTEPHAYPYGSSGNVDLDVYEAKGVMIQGYSDAGDCRRPIAAWVSPEVAELLGLRRKNIYGTLRVDG